MQVGIGRFWEENAGTMAGCLWINPLLGQMAPSLAEPESLSVTVNMGSHPKASSSHILSFSKHKNHSEPNPFLTPVPSL